LIAQVPRRGTSLTRDARRRPTEPLRDRASRMPIAR
jgi:hypothetical protein